MEDILKSGIPQLDKTIAKRSDNIKPDSVIVMTNGWQCCKCGETMYRDEMYCTWHQCGHRRCNKCRSFTK